MKVVFMGTPEFAVASLDAINKVHEVVGVVTVADKPAGRGKKIRFSAVPKPISRLIEIDLRDRSSFSD